MLKKVIIHAEVPLGLVLIYVSYVHIIQEGNGPIWHFILGVIVSIIIGICSYGVLLFYNGLWEQDTLKEINAQHEDAKQQLLNASTDERVSQAIRILYSKKDTGRFYENDRVARIYTQPSQVQFDTELRNLLTERVNNHNRKSGNGIIGWVNNAIFKRSLLALTSLSDEDVKNYIHISRDKEVEKHTGHNFKKIDNKAAYHRVVKHIDTLNNYKKEPLTETEELGRPFQDKPWDTGTLKVLYQITYIIATLILTGYYYVQPTLTSYYLAYQLLLLTLKGGLFVWYTMSCIVERNTFTQERL